MRELGVQSPDEFETWRTKEKAHLHSLSKEPEQETLEMEYFQKLVNLGDAEYVPLPYATFPFLLTLAHRERISAILGVERPFVPVGHDTDYTEAAKATRHIETQHRHTLEVQAKAMAAVHDLEGRLDITVRWIPGDEKWEAVVVMVCRRRYQRALDHLQGLIISRMFELAKCNMSGTGKSLCVHLIDECSPRME
jgi:hypothetical protein